MIWVVGYFFIAVSCALEGDHPFIRFIIAFVGCEVMTAGVRVAMERKGHK